MIDDTDPRWWLHGLPAQDPNDWRDAEPPSGWCENGQHRCCSGSVFSGHHCYCRCHKEKA